MAQKFVKNKDRIVPQIEGNVLELQNGKVYNLLYDRYNEMTYLQEDGSLNMPSKIYNTDEDNKFMDRVIKYFNYTSNQTTGVLLNGIKGTGKTVMAKILAQRSNRPIVVVHEETPTSKINDFYKKIKTETVMIFDEIDKEDNQWREDGLLRFLDGVQSTSKKLVIMTSNDSDKMSKYLFDRCSRIRYIRHFDPKENEKFIMDILKDKEIASNHSMIKDFMINNINLLSIDNILSFIEEIALYEDDSLEACIDKRDNKDLYKFNIENAMNRHLLTRNDLKYIISDMNITTKDNNKNKNNDCENENDEFNNDSKQVLNLLDNAIKNSKENKNQGIFS
jgi:SpoVK/Ycf46/Vps4 family AAA+-type ATPase